MLFQMHPEKLADFSSGVSRGFSRGHLLEKLCGLRNIDFTVFVITLEYCFIFSTSSLAGLGWFSRRVLFFIETRLLRGKRVLSTSSITSLFVLCTSKGSLSMISNSLFGVPMAIKGLLVRSFNLASCLAMSTPLT